MDPRLGDGAPAAEPAGETITTDAVVIGAGPVGLFQVFELGLLDIKAHVIDALPHVGGQPVELYPDKIIYDLPGHVACTGQSLADNLLRQLAPFRPQFHLGQTVTHLHAQADGLFRLSTSAHTHLLTRTVFIAAGVGAFEPRRLSLDGLSAFEGTQLAHHAHDLAGLAGQDVVVFGDTDAALDTALRVAEPDAERARSVTLVHRRNSFKAEPALVRQMRQSCEEGRMRFVAGQPVGLETQAGRLTHLLLDLPDATTLRLPADQVRVLLGLSPRLGPVAEWGLDMERKLLRVDTATFTTSVPGIFAIGDVNTYPGKRKLLVCGFHEATLAAYAAAPIVYPQRSVVLQYTTSSSHLQALLGTQSTNGPHTPANGSGPAQ